MALPLSDIDIIAVAIIIAFVVGTVLNVVYALL